MLKFWTDTSDMAGSENIRHASRIVRSGGVIAYPTEGVFGLGCLPTDYAAVSRVLAIKKRSEALGFILIYSHTEQLNGWAELSNVSLNTPANRPVTWIVPASDAVPTWIRGAHSGVAVRLSTHPVANALCTATGSCLVSTSANLSGRMPVRNAHVLRRQFGTLVDYIVPGRCGPAAGASEIRHLETGNIVRPA